MCFFFLTLLFSFHVELQYNELSQIRIGRFRALLTAVNESCIQDTSLGVLDKLFKLYISAHQYDFLDVSAFQYDTLYISARQYDTLYISARQYNKI